MIETTQLPVGGSQFSVAKLFARARVIAVDKVGRRHSLFSFHLYLEQLQSTSAAAACQETVSDHDFTFA